MTVPLIYLQYVCDFYNIRSAKIIINQHIPEKTLTRTYLFVFELSWLIQISCHYVLYNLDYFTNNIK